MAGPNQFVFGSGLLYGFRIDIANATPRQFGTLQDVSLDFDGDIKDLFGQFQFPVDTARGKTKIVGKAKFATVSGEIFNDIFFGQTLTTGGVVFAYNEAETLPAIINGTTNAITAAANPTLHFASTPVGVTKGSFIIDSTAPTVIPASTYVLAFTGTTVTMSANATGAGVGSGDAIAFGPAFTVANNNAPVDYGVNYALTGYPFEKSATESAASLAGTYNFIPALGAYQFGSADAGASIFVTYTYASASGKVITINNPFMGTTPRFQATFLAQFEGQQVAFTLLSCVAQKLMMSTKLDDYTIPELDFSAFANGAGSIGTLSFVN